MGQPSLGSTSLFWKHMQCQTIYIYTYCEDVLACRLIKAVFIATAGPEESGPDKHMMHHGPEELSARLQCG